MIEPPKPRATDQGLALSRAPHLGLGPTRQRPRCAPGKTLQHHRSPTTTFHTQTRSSWDTPKQRSAPHARSSDAECEQKLKFAINFAKSSAQPQRDQAMDRLEDINRFQPNPDSGGWQP